MAIRVAINGFGRIGRLFLRALIQKGLLGKDIIVVAIVDLFPNADKFIYDLKHDSTHGLFLQEYSSRKSVSSLEDPDILTINGQDILCLMAQKDPSSLPWQKLGIDLVIESSGRFTEINDVAGHITAGAKKVLVTAPSKDVPMVVRGVNDLNWDRFNELSMLSNASCTTNCLAPLVFELLKKTGLVKGLMTTVHAITATQLVVDGPSKKDWRGGRAACYNMIPSTTGAAKAVGIILPEVAGKLTGMSIRVPVIDGSLVDLVYIPERKSSIVQIDECLKEASQGELKGILDFTEEDLVSSDIIGNDSSCIYDSKATLENNLKGSDDFFKLLAWYDNEWGYSNRLVELAQKMFS